MSLILFTFAVIVFSIVFLVFDFLFFEREKKRTSDYYELDF